MNEICGKRLFTTLNELVEPKHTAVIVVDMENDFCHLEGHFPKHGSDVSMLRPMIPTLVEFVGKARSHGVPVIFIQSTDERAHLSDSPAWLYFRTKGRKYVPGATPGFTIEGTWGQQIISELQPLPNEVIVKKHRSSAFVNTGLDLILRSNGVETVVITGMVTQGCVESTVRSASCYDYYVVLVSDCIRSTNKELHDAAWLILSSQYDTATSYEIATEWKR